MNIDVNKAIKLCFEYIKDLYNNQNQNIPNLLLEEVELDEYQSQWLITIGFDSFHEKTTTDTLSSSLSIFPKKNSVTTTERERIYKVVRIDANDGKFISMKIRELV
jgi:hypothetical protein